MGRLSDLPREPLLYKNLKKNLKIKETLDKGTFNNCEELADCSSCSLINLILGSLSILDIGVLIVVAVVDIISSISGTGIKNYFNI